MCSYCTGQESQHTPVKHQQWEVVSQGAFTQVGFKLTRFNFWSWWVSVNAKFALWSALNKRIHCAAMLMTSYARKWSMRRWPEQQVTHLLECVFSASSLWIQAKMGVPHVSRHGNKTLRQWFSIWMWNIPAATDWFFFFPVHVCGPHQHVWKHHQNKQCSGGVAGTDSGGESAEVNLRQVVEGPRRMFQDPDSNTPPNTTANRPDQKAVAVTQQVVTRCAAVRNNNSSHESERWSVRASPSLPDGRTCFVLLTVMKDYVTNKAWQRLFM